MSDLLHLRLSVVNLRQYSPVHKEIVKEDVSHLQQPAGSQFPQLGRHMHIGQLRTKPAEKGLQLLYVLLSVVQMGVLGEIEISPPPSRSQVPQPAALLRLSSTTEACCSARVASANRLFQFPQLALGLGQRQIELFQLRRNIRLAH